MPFRKLSWVVLAVIGAGILQWIIIPAPQLPPPTRQPEAAWQPPAGQRPRPQKASELLRNAELWGKLPETEAERTLADPPWRFLGIVRNGAQRFVMIKIEGQPEQSLTVNDTLPGGSKILKIEDDALCLLINGKQRRLPIHKQGPQIL